MNVVVVIPVGPGHKELADFACVSVRAAWHFWRGYFESMKIEVVDDTSGDLGRSAARNLGVRRHPTADFYFFLDADDRMELGAFACVDPEAPATFGAIKLNSRWANNVFPVTRATLFTHGARGTIAMGCFVRGDVARSTLFDESLDVGEDFDFYLRLPWFVKIKQPLVTIGYDQPSAGGPRGYDNVDWFAACDAVIARYREAPR